MTAWILAVNTSNRTEVFRQMRTQFGEADPGLWWKVPFVLVLLAIALLLVFILARIERNRMQQHVTPQPMKLYLSALIKLKIAWQDIFQLWKLAYALNLEHPAVLLISEASYNDALTRYCEDGNRRRANAHKRLIAIRDMLFGINIPNAGSQSNPSE